MMTQPDQAKTFKKALILYEVYKRHPLTWMRDTLKSHDEWDEQMPVKPFPIDLYTKYIVNELVKEDIVNIAKSRQMKMSWVVMAYLLHKAQFVGHRLIAVFSKKETDAFEMVERAKFMYQQQPEWLKRLCPLDRKLRDMPYGHLYFDNMSKVQGFAQGKDQVRSYVPSIVFFDEAAFQEKFQETYEASLSCTKQIITISSAGAGFFQQLCDL